MQVTFTKKKKEVLNGKMTTQHQCMICFAKFDTVQELWDHEDLVHADVGLEEEDDTTIETEDVDDDDNPLSHAS